MLTDKLVIGFGHKARHGKNLCADAIHQRFPELTRVISFADSLKAHCRVAYGMRSKDGPLLQMVGTDLYRKNNPNIWVDILEATAAEYSEPVILIPDVRFPNEVEFCNAAVKVTRYNADGSVFVTKDRDPQHPSEIALDSYDAWRHTIQNHDGEIELLKANALAVFAFEYENWRETERRIKQEAEELKGLRAAAMHGAEQRLPALLRPAVRAAVEEAVERSTLAPVPDGHGFGYVPQNKMSRG